MRKQSRINLDRLELTYTASDEVRTYLSDKNVQRYELESVTLIREQSRLYENEFSIIVQDYNKELGVFDCCIGYLHFPKRRERKPLSYNNDCRTWNMRTDGEGEHLLPTE